MRIELAHNNNSISAFGKVGHKIGCKVTLGFTLLEVLIAIAIFSIISLTSFTIFDTVLSGDESSKLRTERLNELQRGFLIIERDITQLARRSVRVNGESPQTHYLYAKDAEQGEAAIAFVRNGWTNPGLLLPRSDMQGVAYGLKENTLVRFHANFVDPVLGEEPKERPLISNVNSVKFEFYQKGKWQDEFDIGKIPQAIAIELETDDFGNIRRQFLVAGDTDITEQEDNQ